MFLTPFVTESTKRAGWSFGKVLRSVAHGGPSMRTPWHDSQFDA
jgi:hypothetical protein